MIDGVLWLGRRWQPREGWLALVVTAAALWTAVYSVLTVGWVAEDGVMIPAAVGGFGLAWLLARRPLATAWAWLLLGVYGVAVPVLDVANLGFGAALWGRPWAVVRQVWLENGTLFTDRVTGWVTAVSSGSRTQETVLFALGLGWLAWFLSAWVAWACFRQKRPFPALAAVGLVLAANSYFGQPPLYLLTLYMGLAAWGTAVIHQYKLESHWTQHHIDYPDQIRIDISVYTGTIALALMMLATAVPAISPTQLASRLLTAIGAEEAEAEFSRIFAGVEQPRRQTARPDSPGQAGILPRSYLLGTPPELLETVMMRARIEEEVPLPAVWRWRGLSYDTYTGRGWTLTELRRETFAANEAIPHSPLAAQTTVRQRVQWVGDARVLRYAVGDPVQFSQEVAVTWREAEDMVRAMSDVSPVYFVTSRVPVADPDELRAAAVTAVPSTILNRYTQLPPNLPARVTELAQTVAGGYDNGYDQALALARFLRQYPYSLDVPPPPDDGDLVDYFLFDLQAGYCDYYASSMVVMARTLGLPARLAVGYLPQPPDEEGVQTIWQVNGHSWAEVYFAGYGWVAFEPTAPFAEGAGAVLAESAAVAETAVPPPLPVRDEKRPFARWLAMSGAGLLAGLAVWWWRARRLAAAAGAEGIYGRLVRQAVRLGLPAVAGRTPLELAQLLTARLDVLAGREWWGQRWAAGRVTAVKPTLASFIELYNEHQYRHSPHEEMLGVLWRQMERPLIALVIWQKFTSINHDLIHTHNPNSE